MSYSTIGVIGHVNHGKTTLVQRLTGVNTDTLEEEQRRGITIDLGFAAAQFGSNFCAFIDAPGHQRYIGNMLVGAASIDAALLIVAADQGIQEQTLEHAAIVHALGVSRLVVAVTRIDLVDKSSLPGLAEEICLFMGDVGYREYPVVFVSALTGEGLDQLQHALEKVADGLSDQKNSIDDAFRMPIDRVFGVSGRGLVVAGTIWQGQVKIGDTLQVARTKSEFRVRDLESHSRKISLSLPGRRTAINLVGGSIEEIQRGDELVTPGYLHLREALIVDLQLFSHTHPLQCPATVYLHTATNSCKCRILGQRVFQSGEREVVIVRPQDSIVATYGQPLLFRKPHPVGSFASGKVLGASALRGISRKKLLQLGLGMLNDNPCDRLDTYVETYGECPIDSTLFSTEIGLTGEGISDVIGRLVSQNKVVIDENTLLSSKAIEQCEKVILAAFSQSQKESPWLVESSVVDKASKATSPRLARIAIKNLLDSQQVIKVGDKLADSNLFGSLPKRQRQLFDRLILHYIDNPAPGTTKEVAEQFDASLEVVASLTRLAVQQSLLVEVSGSHGLLYAPVVLRRLQDQLGDVFAQHSTCSVSMIRDRWSDEGSGALTRKHVVPLLEFFDRIGVTIRQGDERRPGPQLSAQNWAEVNCEQD